jgi:GNAT superfamily N-acetyltransferase|nr:MAG TPA: acetyltransferase domain containing protein [Caudoviricetes sp.]
MIQKQSWKDEIRILITDEENLGSVQISIPLYVSDIFGKADALIYALFVDNNHRRNGVAKSLLQLAEQQAKLNGVKTIGLEFNKDESDRFVLDWYLRSGYKPFNKKSNLLIKELED